MEKKKRRSETDLEGEIEATPVLFRYFRFEEKQKS